MILTGKAKEDYKSEIGDANFEYRLSLGDVLHNALIVEWFDECTNIEIVRFIYGKWVNSFELSYKQATEQAVTKANQIYNEK